MYFLIEHNGTSDHIKIASKITDYALDEFGATCEEAVGYKESITVYNDGLEKVAEFRDTPSDRDLHFYLAITSEDE